MGSLNVTTPGRVRSVLGQWSGNKIWTAEWEGTWFAFTTGWVLPYDCVESAYTHWNILRPAQPEPVTCNIRGNRLERVWADEHIPDLGLIFNKTRDKPAPMKRSYLGPRAPLLLHVEPYRRSFTLYAEVVASEAVKHTLSLETVMMGLHAAGQKAKPVEHGDMADRARHRRQPPSPRMPGDERCVFLWSGRPDDGIEVRWADSLSSEFVGVFITRREPVNG